MARSQPSELLHNLIQAVEGAQGNLPCKLCVALEEFPAETRKGIQGAIEATRPDGRRALGPKRLTAILNESGIQVSQYMVERHQNEGHQ